MNKSSESHVQVFLTRTGVSIGNKDIIIYQMDLQDYAVYLYCGLLISIESMTSCLSNALHRVPERCFSSCTNTVRFSPFISSFWYLCGDGDHSWLWLLLIYQEQKEVAEASCGIKAHQTSIPLFSAGVCTVQGHCNSFWEENIICVCEKVTGEWWLRLSGLQKVSELFDNSRSLCEGRWLCHLSSRKGQEIRRNRALQLVY